MKMTKADHIGKSREQIKEEIIRDSVRAMDSRFSAEDMKKFMLLDKPGQKSFVTAAMTGPETRKK